MALYRVAVNKVDWLIRNGQPVLYNRRTIGLMDVPAETEQEIELLYILARETSPLTYLLRGYEEGHYTLTVMKQTVSGKLSNLPIFKFDGWALISKRNDLVFWDTRYMNIGNLNTYNLGVRDPREEVRNMNWHSVPGGGI